MGDDYQPATWETVSETIRNNIESTIKIVRTTPELYEVKSLLPFGISKYNNAFIVTWRAVSFRPQAMFRMTKHATGLIQRIELDVGIPLIKRIDKDPKYRYIARRNNPLIVSRLIVSTVNIGNVIQGFIKECNRVKMLYCE